MPCARCGSWDHSVSRCPLPLPGRQRGLIGSDLLARLGGLALVAVVLVGAGWGLRAKWERSQEQARERAVNATRLRWADQRIEAENAATERAKVIEAAASAAGGELDRLRVAVRAANRQAARSADVERAAATSARDALAECADRRTAVARELEVRDDDLRKVLGAWPR